MRWNRYIDYGRKQTFKTVYKVNETHNIRADPSQEKFTQYIRSEWADCKRAFRKSRKYGERFIDAVEEYCQPPA